MDEECGLLVYRTVFGAPRYWTADCDEHEWCHNTLLFSDAIGRAMLHQRAAIR